MSNSADLAGGGRELMQPSLIKPLCVCLGVTPRLRSASGWDVGFDRAPAGFWQD